MITITGTNDVPVIDAATNPAAIAESAGDSSAQDIPSVNGTITVTDQDLGDTLTLCVTGNATASYNGGAVPVENSVNVSALIATGAISFDRSPPTASSRRSTGTTTRPPPTSTGCAPGDTLTLTYVAQVNDGHGNVGAQNLVITITGTNDVADDRRRHQPGPIAESAGDSSAAGHPAGRRHHHHHRPGPRRHADAQRHRQCRPPPTTAALFRWRTPSTFRR